jgi:hypothetical protein
LKKLLIFLPLLVTFSLLCFKRPKLQTEITVPLFSQTLWLREILDSNYSHINPDSTIELFYQARIDTFRVNDSLRIFEMGDTVNLLLSDFIIENLAHSPLTLTLMEISGFNLPDTTTPIQPFDTTLYGQEIVLSGIENLNIVEMVLRFEVSNFTHLSFDSVGLNLHQIGNFSLGSIEPLQTVTRRERIQGLNLSDSIIVMDIGISSPGSALPVRLSSNDSLKIDLFIDSLRIISGTFRVPVNGMHATRTVIGSFPSNYRLHVDSVTFLTGNLNLTLQNELPCPIQAFVNIKEFQFDSIVNLPARAYNNITIDVSDRTYINTDSALTPLTYSTEVVIEPSAQPIRFEAPEFFSVSYLLTNPKIASFTGTVLDTIRSQIRPKTICFNFPQGLTHINIEHAELEAEVVSSLDFQALFYLRIEVNNNQGDQRVIDTILEIQPGTPSFPRTTNLLMDITQLINIVPKNIIITGYQGVTGNGRAEAESFFTGNYSFSSPLRLAFDSSTINLRQQEVNIEEKYRDDIERYLASGEITAKYINHLPFGLNGVLKVESPNTNPVAIPFRVPMPEIDELTGFVSAPQETTITIALDSDQVNVFKQNSSYASVSLFLPKTDTVTLTARDYFSVEHSYCKLKLNLLK